FDTAMARDLVHAVPAWLSPVPGLSVLRDLLPDPDSERSPIPVTGKGAPGEAGSGGEEHDPAARFAAMDPEERSRSLLREVREHTAVVLGHRAEAGSEVDPDRPFTEQGTDSLTSVELRNRLSAAVGVRVPATAVFDHPNPRALARFLTGLLTPELPAPEGRTGQDRTTTPPGTDGDGDAIDSMGVDELVNLALRGPSV
ncbi:acyl carrier protein, partial [Streptomyces sp. NPDC000931]